jgi:hypothetical protein
MNTELTHAPRARVEASRKRSLSSAEVDEYTRFVDEARGGCYVQARQWANASIAGRRFAVQWFVARARGEILGTALVLRPRAIGALLLPVALIERGPVQFKLDFAKPPVRLARGHVRWL